MKSWALLIGGVVGLIAGALLQPEPSAGQEANAEDASKKVVFIAGPPSHGYGAHEHYAGCMILAEHIEALDGFTTEVYKHRWPDEPNAFEGVDAIVIYADGGGRHPVLAHLEEIDKLARQGIGVVLIHYAVEVPKGEPGTAFLDWIGGYFEAHWSVNPHWTGKFDELPNHPVTRGVQPFSINDEWYYHMRFREGMDGVTPVLTDVPPPETLSRPDGSHSGNPHVRATAGQPQHVAWTMQRNGGGRGFGFTGGHVHWNWGHPDFRKLVLNAIVWAAQAEVPEEGVPAQPLTLEELEANQDFPQPENFDRQKIQAMLDSFSGQAG